MKSVKNDIKKMDKPLLIMSIIYTIIGVFIVLSASSVSAVIRYDEGPYYFFIKQIVFFAIGYILGIIILRYPIKRFKKWINLMSIGMILILLYTIVNGVEVNGAKSWIDLGLFNFQPSEIAKTAIIMYFGFFFGDLKLNGKFSFVMPIMFSTLICFLVFLQPDLGTCAVLAALSLALFISVPFKNNQTATILKVVSGAVAVFAVVFMMFGGSFLNEMQIDRLNFKEPCTRYTENTGYQVCNGFIALNNGGLFGKGIGNSTQKYLYLPDSHTDMIFPIFVEELGLIAGIVFILGYVFILYRILKIARGASNIRNSIIAYGVFIYLLLHIFINLLGILALIPFTGIPLPFLSYGGTYTINLMICIFLVLRISIENKIDKTKEEIRRI